MVARAQQTRHSARVVADPENAVIPGATVTFTPASGNGVDHAVAERWNLCVARCSAGDLFGYGDDARLSRRT